MISQSARWLCILCVLAWDATAAAETRIDPSVHLPAAVEVQVSPYLDTGNFSGTILLARGDEIVFTESYGFSDIASQVANTRDTGYYLASSSRIFTSAAMMWLVQHGQASLDDRLSKWDPDWPRGDEITVHHLMSLSSGMPNINELPGYDEWSQHPQTPASLIAHFRNLPLEFPPGERSEHSNSNYVVLAWLIEQISGQTYGEFLQETFFGPLGMDRTGHDAEGQNGKPVAWLATGYLPVGLAALEPDPNAQMAWSVKTGNGSVYSTVDDLFRFDRMLRHATILNDNSTQQLFTEHFASNGYGWFVRDDETLGKVISISGRSPGFGSSWVRATGDDLTVIVLGNIYNGVSWDLSRALLAILHGELPKPPSLSRARPDPAVVRTAVGDYQFGPDFYAPNALVPVRERDGQLFNEEAWLIPNGPWKFLHRIYWTEMTFLHDAGGQATALEYGGFVGARVSAAVE